MPATNDLRVSLFVRANRAGVRIYGRVILPADTDPETGQPSFVLVPGTIYENVDRWQRIELAGLPPSIESQARVIRASTRRPVRLEGAYLDRIVVNLYCGAGQTEVFLDELSVAPVPPEVVAAQARPAAADAEAAAPKVGDAPARSAPRSGSRSNGTGSSGTAPTGSSRPSRRRGPTWPSSARRASTCWSRTSMPTLRGSARRSTPGSCSSPTWSAATASRSSRRRHWRPPASFPLRDKVAFWGLGDQLGRIDDPEARKAELERVRAIKSGFRGLPRDFSHLVTGTVADGFSLYAQAPKHLDILAVRPE